MGYPKIVWEGQFGEEMDEVNAMIVLTPWKSPVKVPEAPKVKRNSGVVTRFCDERGFGFIRSGASRIFFHISNLHDDMDTAIIPAGTRVTFEESTDKAGRPCAVNIKSN